MQKRNQSLLTILMLQMLVISGCKSPRWASESLDIRFEPVPSPPIIVEHRWSYGLWWFWGWAPGGIETIGQYQSDANGKLFIKNLDADRDHLVIDDPRFEPVAILGPGEQPVTARSYDEQNNTEQTIGVASDGIITIRLRARKKQ